MADIELKQRRGRVKGSLTRLKTFIESITNETTIEEIETRFERLEKLWDEFESVDEALAALSVNSEMEEFENNFFMTCSLYRKAIKSRSPLNANERNLGTNNGSDNLNDSSHPMLDQFNSSLTRFVEQQRNLWDSYSHLPHASDVRLPKVNIPHFNGDYKEWPAFKDLFSAMVDTRTGLTLVQKFQYLKGLVTGEAASLIKHLPITEGNYTQAWEKLQNRYDKKKHILTEYIKSFYNQPMVSYSSSTQLRQLADTSDELIRGVNALGEEAKGRDPWLIYAILSKTDADSRKAWAEETVGNDIPSLEELFKFLNKRCDALQAFDAPLKRPVTRASVRTYHADNNMSCIKCSQSHQLYKCPDFKKMDIVSRRAFTSKNALCFNCLSSGHPANRCKSKNSCHHCGKPHHSLLHETNTALGRIQSHHAESNRLESPTSTESPSINFNPNAEPFLLNSGEMSNLNGKPTLTSLAVFHTRRSVLPLIPTALVNVTDASGRQQVCRVLIDSGSQASFVSEECAQRLGHKRTPAKVMVHGLGSCRSGTTHGCMYLKLQSRCDKSQHITILTYVLPKLTSLQPSAYFDPTAFTFMKEYNLADPYFNHPSKIDILIGADYFIHILADGKYATSPEIPSLQNTIFGYVVSGSIDISMNSRAITSLHVDTDEINKTLRAFWEIEEIPQGEPHYTNEERFCENLFAQTHFVDKDSGRYVVRLPIKITEDLIGDTLRIATSRLKSMEKKFASNENFRNEYHKFMREYKALGHLEPAVCATSNSRIEQAYLPHHAVLKPTSLTTKLRVVFDGSTISSSGVTLNKKLCVGPKVQRDLFPILISFRTFKIAIVADIQKMYRQILVNELDRDYQRIVWRDNPDEPIQHYRLTTVTYGTSSAPFLATRSLKQAAEDFKSQYPLAANTILQNFYVDDLLGGAGDVATAVKLHKELNTVLSSRGFPLHKWASNSGPFLDAISENSTISSIKLDQQPETIKVLGLKWISSGDSLSFDVNLAHDSIPTKRQILSESSTVFDPLGLLAPVTVMFKIMLQQLWLGNYDWDEQISADLAAKWKRIHKSLHHLNQLHIPRWLKTRGENYELHGFSDASELAYVAAVYCRTENDTGEISTILLAAKTRVAPVKQISIPRLELNGALLLAKLLHSIKIALNEPNINCIAWTDSSVVLAWLSSHPCTWKTYIANRTSEILTILPRQAWHHVRSHDNPADLASRGILPTELHTSTLWWTGPRWLSSDWKSYPHDGIRIGSEDSTDMERKPRILKSLQASVENDTLMDIFQQSSSFIKILRILAMCNQFINRCRKLESSKEHDWITSGELDAVRRVCIKWAQASAFSNEITALQKKRALPSSSVLLSLSPFLDSENILRIGGRLDKSSCSYETKHPIILPKNHILAKRLIAYLHIKYLHLGTNGLLSIVRKTYWILSCRTLIKRHINSCIQCVRQRAQTSKQLMASLPSPRISFTRAFENIGVDYAGPLSLLLHRGRGARNTKGYIAVFICLSTRAMHLEAVSDLTSDAFIACFKRFISRRGIPASVYSDNGTNFVGANRKLCELFKLTSSNHYKSLIAEFSASNSIKWNFNPPSAPHFGGSWESGVKLVKTHLRRTVGETRLTFEELTTLLAQTEGILNSRPLTPITDDIDCFDVLTPGHFIIGKPLAALPEPSIEDIPTSMLTRWRLAQKMYHDFWNRWYKEYLVTLQHRPKWRREHTNLEIGNLVLIKEDNMPPATWALGRITQLHAGRDNLVRVVTVRTSSGEVKRPIAKLCKLPIC